MIYSMSVKKILKILLPVFLLMPLYGADGARTVKSSVTPEKGTVGQQFVYTLSIAGKDLSGVKITLPEKGEFYPPAEKKEKNKNDKKSESGEDENSVPLYIINGASKVESDAGDMKQITVLVEMNYYRTGVHQLPEINVVDSDGVKIGYSIPAVTVEELNKEGKPEDIEPPLELSGNYRRIIIAILAVIAAAAAGYFVYRYFKNRKKVTPVCETKQTPEEFFMSEIERLKLRECIEKGKVNEYVFGISITFRRFLSMELGFDAAEMTTGEISLVIKRYLADGKSYADEIMRIMEAWDLSKFAEFALSREVLTANLGDTISAVQQLSALRSVDNGQP